MVKVSNEAYKTIRSLQESRQSYIEKRLKTRLAQVRPYGHEIKGPRALEEGFFKTPNQGDRPSKLITPSTELYTCTVCTPMEIVAGC